MGAPTEPTHAVLYAAKSTEDRKGSIPTQLADCRALAEREGWEVAGEFSDEAFSAYSGNRGPGLERAKALAVASAPSVLVAQHSDRVARGAGDAPDAAEHLVEVVAALRRQGVTLRTCQDDFFADPRLGHVMAAMMGLRNTEDSARKSEATRAGLKRRRERGQPVGAVPLGYIAETQAIKEQVITTRSVDPATVGTVERIFGLVEAGATFGQVARTLTAEGLTGRRGNPFRGRTIRDLIHNEAFCGRKGYPAIIEPERFDAIQASLTRLDPARLARRKGGRPPDPSYFLRGLVFCRSCGSALWTRRLAGGRSYTCGERRQGTGLCDAATIPAELIEDHVLRHLDSFVGSVEAWLAERVDERDGERGAREAAVLRRRSQLTDLDRQRDRYLVEYRRLEAEGASTAYIVLEEVERIDRERGEQEKAIREAEAILGEWSGPPDVDAALDYYTALVDLIHGRIRDAEGARELNDALSTVVAGLWAEIDDDRLLVEFELVDQPESVLPGGVPVMFDQRPTLPPRHLDDRIEHPLRPGETGSRTLVLIQPGPLEKPR